MIIFNIFILIIINTHIPVLVFMMKRLLFKYHEELN